MTIEKTEIKDLFVLTPNVLGDNRGFFMEVYRKDKLFEAGITAEFVQENHSRSKRGVVRGLHFQWTPPMAKLMRVSLGKAFIVAVDIRKQSKTLGKWFGIEASSDNKKMLYAPAGFARGFLVLSPWAEIQYLCTSIYNPNCESGILWNDPKIDIKWPINVKPIQSEKDKNAQTLDAWLKRKESNFFMK